MFVPGGAQMACWCTGPACSRLQACPTTAAAAAGFYLNATQEPWSRHWRMYDYITQELPALLRTLPELDVDRVGGH